MAASFCELAMGFRNHVIDAYRAALLLDRAQRRVDDGDGDVATARRQLIWFAGAAALSKHLKLGAEHIALGNLQLFAFAVTVLAALDIERRGLVYFFRRD